MGSETMKLSKKNQPFRGLIATIRQGLTGTVVLKVMAMAIAFTTVSVYGRHVETRPADYIDPLFVLLADSDHYNERIPGHNITGKELRDLLITGSIEEIRDYLESEKDNPNKLDPSVLLYSFESSCGEDIPERVELLLAYGADPDKGIKAYYGLTSSFTEEKQSNFDGKKDDPDYNSTDCFYSSTESLRIAKNKAQYMNTALTGGSGGGTTSTPSISGSVREEGYFGSIAGYAGDGTAFAYAFEFGSRQEARDEALDQCNAKLGADEGSCEVKASFSGSDKCAVIATNYDNNGTTVGIAHGARSKTTIQKEALRECNKDRPDGEGSCRIYVKWCGPDADV